jgi:hypothetical protein
MALATLSQLQSWLGSTSDEAAMNAALSISDRAVRSWLGRNVELAEYTEFYDGLGWPDIVLRQFPVVIKTTIAESETELYPEVWLDAAGYYGANADGFDADSELTYGEDFAILIDQSGYAGPDTQATASKSGILRRLGNGLRSEILGRPSGSLSSRWRQAVWPVGQGNVKVHYWAGYVCIPEDISGAVLQMAAMLYRTKSWGGAFINAGRLGEYSRNLVSAMNGNGPMADQVGSMAMLLAPYRELVA